MKYVRFSHKGQTSYGLLEDGIIRVIKGDIFGSFEITEREVQLEEAIIISPCSPSKIVALGLNYRDHAEEMNFPIPEKPILFMKPSSCIIGPEEAIVKPEMCSRLDYEAELGIVIGRKARHISPGDAEGVILGVTCFNDVTARDLQPKDGQWTLSKSFDTFGPLGPCIATGLDYNNLNIELRLNGEVKQKSNTKNFIFRVEEVVSYISQVMTLLPGDVIVTGTPSGVGEMRPGDVVEVSIEGIGTLRNYVK